MYFNVVEHSRSITTLVLSPLPQYVLLVQFIRLFLFISLLELLILALAWFEHIFQTKIKIKRKEKFEMKIHIIFLMFSHKFVSEIHKRFKIFMYVEYVFIIWIFKTQTFNS